MRTAESSGQVPCRLSLCPLRFPGLSEFYRKWIPDVLTTCTLGGGWRWQAPASAVLLSMRQLALEFAAPPPTLENFVAGRNAELLQSLKGLVSGGTGERFIYIWGMAGSGRSHLLHGAVAAMRATGADAAYLACSGDTRFGEEIVRAGFVAVDDADCLGEAAQVALFNLYNTLREGRGTMLVSGNAPPVQLGLREDLVTRLGWGLVYQVHALSDEEKAQALTRHAEARGVRLSAEVCDYLLNRVRRDMPSLLAMLDALDRHSLETRRRVTVPMVRELLQPHRAPAKNG